MRQLVFIALLFAQLAVCAQTDDSVVLLHGTDRQLTPSEIRQKRAIEAWEMLPEAYRTVWSNVFRETFTPWQLPPRIDHDFISLNPSPYTVTLPWTKEKLIDTGLKNITYMQRSGTDTIKALFLVYPENNTHAVFVKGYYVLRWVAPAAFAQPPSEIELYKNNRWNSVGVKTSEGYMIDNGISSGIQSNAASVTYRTYKVMRMLNDGTIVKYVNDGPLSMGISREDCLGFDKKAFPISFFILSVYQKDWR